MKRIFLLRLLLLSFAIGLALPAFGQATFRYPRFEVQRTNGVVYGQGQVQSPAPGAFDLLLDLYEPTGPGVPAVKPVFLTIHGGGFTGGSRTNASHVRICNEMASRGYVCASIDYRLDGQDPVVGPAFQTLEADLVPRAAGRADAIAAAVEDAVTALDWLVGQAGVLGIDTGRIGIGGSSAGAITSLIVAYSRDDHAAPTSPAVHFVVDLWGSLYDFAGDLEAGEPPLIIIHGELDPTVPFQGALDLANQAAAVGVRAEFRPVPGAGHGFGAVPIFDLAAEPGASLWDRAVEEAIAALDPMALLPPPLASLPPGDYPIVVPWRDGDRTALLHVPPAYDTASKLPLVVGLHGGFGSGSQFATSNGWIAKSDAEGFLAVFPDGTGAIPTWNAVHCCGSAFQNDVDDVGFVRFLIETLREVTKVDGSRIYVTGHSNGGMLTHRLATEASRTLAAVAPVAGAIGGNPAESEPQLLPELPPVPVPIRMVHGLLDPNVPFDGGVGSGPGAANGRNDLPVIAGFAFWLGANGDEPVSIPPPPDPGVARFVAGPPEREVGLDVILDGGHEWEGSTTDPTPSGISTTDLVWDFLRTKVRAP